MGTLGQVFGSLLIIVGGGFAIFLVMWLGSSEEYIQWIAVSVAVPSVVGGALVLTKYG